MSALPSNASHAYLSGVAGACLAAQCHHAHRCYLIREGAWGSAPMPPRRSALKDEFPTLGGPGAKGPEDAPVPPAGGPPPPPPPPRERPGWDADERSLAPAPGQCCHGHVDSSVVQQALCMACQYRAAALALLQRIFLAPSQPLLLACLGTFVPPPGAGHQRLSPGPFLSECIFSQQPGHQQPGHLRVQASLIGACRRC